MGELHDVRSTGKSARTSCCYAADAGAQLISGMPLASSAARSAQP